VFNGDTLVYTTLACGNNFADELAFDGSQNQPNSANATSVIYDTRTNSYSSLPYKGEDFICSAGVGASCNQPGNRADTLVKETPSSAVE
jgi:hypothetical protein